VVEVRLAEPGVLILASLSGGPKHGYALMKDIEQIAGVTLGPGTLYGALVRLEQQGMVAALPAEDRRRPYEITPGGAEAVRAYLESVQRLAVVGLRRLDAYA
jgi:DNA-binding PadR family transcriptional regulator